MAAAEGGNSAVTQLRTVFNEPLSALAGFGPIRRVLEGGGGGSRMNTLCVSLVVQQMALVSRQRRH